MFYCYFQRIIDLTLFDFSHHRLSHHSIVGSIFGGLSNLPVSKVQRSSPSVFFQKYLKNFLLQFQAFRHLLPHFLYRVFTPLHLSVLAGQLEIERRCFRFFLMDDLITHGHIMDTMWTQCGHKSTSG